MGAAAGEAISVPGLDGAGLDAAGLGVAVSAIGVWVGALASGDFACVQLLRGT
jgi:hypothetical protein